MSFIWYELMTTDPDAAAGFYGEVVGWHIAGSPDPGSGDQDYRMIVCDDGGNAGGVLRLTREMCDAGAGPMWIPYLYTDDVDALLKTIQSEGGVVQMPPTDLPVGRISMVTDPQGVPIYVMDPIPPDDAPETASNVFAPDARQRAGWNELASPDLKASKSFYARHFGFEFNDVMNMGEMGDYCFIDKAGVRLGAMMQQQDGSQPPAWLTYFRVPSIAAASDAILNNGGKVVLAPHEVPSGDWVLIASDPQGAGFALVGQPG